MISRNLCANSACSFTMNGILWKVIFCDPNSYELIDRTNTLRLATTDPKTHAICISNRLSGAFLKRVLKHELGHCVMFSYGLLSELHSFVLPNMWIEAEEWVCNFIADYSSEVFDIVDYIFHKMG